MKRQRTYLDSQLIYIVSNVSSFFFFFFIFPIFSKNIGSHDLLPAICIPRDDCLGERLLFKSSGSPPSPPVVTLSSNYIFQLAVVHLVSQSYRRLVRAIISPFMILSQGSCIYVHASQFNGKHMRPIVEGYPRCVPFFSLRVLRLPFCLPSLAEITSECYLNPFHSP